MEKVKYIPGDLVSFCGKYYNISSIEDNALVTSIEANGFKRDLFPKQGQSLEPVPLTPEILEKNGWKKSDVLVDEDGSEHHVYENKRELINIWYIPESGYFLPFIGNQHLLTSFKYVHQLQHLLFGLGLPMDLKV